jgi:GNAT superfamily N-acetyltransferase
MNYEFRPVEVTDRHLALYVELFRICYQRSEKYSLAYVQWQYRDNPVGPIVGFDAWHGDQLAAHYVVLPQRYRIVTGEIVPGALSLNTVTHPEHQGKGLFTRLARETFEKAGRDGFRLITGVANAASFPGFTKKLEFRHLGQIPLLVGSVRDVLRNRDRRAGMYWDAEGLEWRIEDPGSTYFRAPLPEGDMGLYYHARPLPVLLGRFEEDEASALSVLPIKRWPFPSLIPVFGRAPSGTMNVPRRFMPSPWHLIGRTLADGSPGDVFRDWSVLGIDMDSF